MSALRGRLAVTRPSVSLASAEIKASPTSTGSEDAHDHTVNSKREEKNFTNASRVYEIIIMSHDNNYIYTYTFLIK